MAIGFEDIWDFHTDLRHVQATRDDRPYLLEQIDLPAAARLGGLFSATGRKVDTPLRKMDDPQDIQLEHLREQIQTIKEAKGLTLVLSAADLDGAGRQVMHAEGIYYIEKEKDLGLLDWLWEEGFRSLAPLYNADNALGGGGTGDPGRGLTPLGGDFARKAWERGFLIDCAHMNHKSKEELADLALATGNALHYSHGHLDEPINPELGQRGVPRELVRKLTASGGLIGLMPHPGFVGTFKRHMEEMEFLAGFAPDQVVFGSDFAGINKTGPTGHMLFEECKGVWGVPAYAERIAAVHGEDFARAYAGGSLKACLQGALPR